MISSSREQTEKKCVFLQQVYLDTNSFDGQQEGIEWMKAGDLHELLLLLIWYAWLDSLEQGVRLESTKNIKKRSLLINCIIKRCRVQLKLVQSSVQMYWRNVNKWCY